jgi:hypothetical protein
MPGPDTLSLPPSPPEMPGVAEPWPAMAELILSAMESGRHRNGTSAAAAAARDERRALPRLPYRVRGRLRLFSDGPHSTPRVIYTRDAHARGLGFITPHRLPLGYGGFVEFTGPDGRPRRIQCTLHRCREAAPGWYEGAVCFNREQPELTEIG